MKNLLKAFLVLLSAVACDQIPSFDQNKTQNKSIVVEAEATTETVEFTAIDSWTATSSENWIKATPSSGEAGTHQLLLEIQANPTSQSREAVVSITATAGITVDIKFTVTQKGRKDEGGNEGDGGDTGGGDEGEDEGGNEGDGGDGGGDEGEDEGGNEGDGGDTEGGDDHGYGKGDDFGGSFE